MPMALTEKAYFSIILLEAFGMQTTMTVVVENHFLEYLQLPI